MTPKQDLDGIASIPSSTAIASSAGTRTNAKPNYRPQASNTNIEADIYLFERLRQLSLKQRVEMFIQSDRCVKKLCLRDSGILLSRRSSGRFKVGARTNTEYYPYRNDRQR